MDVDNLANLFFMIFPSIVILVAWRIHCIKSAKERRKLMHSKLKSDYKFYLREESLEKIQHRLRYHYIFERDETKKYIIMARDNFDRMCEIANEIDDFQVVVVNANN